MHYPTILSWESASLLYFLNRQNMVCIIFSMLNLNGKIWKGQIFSIKRTAWKGSLGPRIWWRRSKKHTYQPFYLQILLGYRLCIKYHKTCQIPVWKFTESPICLLFFSSTYIWWLPDTCMQFHIKRLSFLPIPIYYSIFYLK